MKPLDEDVKTTPQYPTEEEKTKNYLRDWIYANDPYEYESNKEWPDYYDMDLPPIA